MTSFLTTTPLWTLLPIITLGTWAGCSLLLAFMRRRLTEIGALEKPSVDNLLTKPLPRGAGLALMLFIVPGLAFCLGTTMQARPQDWLLLGLVLLVVIAWFEDLHPNIPLVARLVVRGLAAYLGTLALPESFLVFPSLVPNLPFAVDRGAVILAWVGLMGGYARTDSLSGLSSILTLGLVGGVALVMSLPLGADPVDLRLAALLIGAAAAAFVFTWPPAKLILGHAGTIPLGFLAGYLLLKLGATGCLPAALILILYPAAEGVITPLRWMFQRKPFPGAPSCERVARALGNPRKALCEVAILQGGLIALALGSTMNGACVWPPYVAGGLAVALVGAALGRWNFLGRRAQVPAEDAAPSA